MDLTLIQERTVYYPETTLISMNDSYMSKTITISDQIGYTECFQKLGMLDFKNVFHRCLVKAGRRIDAV